MLQTLKTYDKSFAEGMLARTSFYLDDDSMFRTFKPIENEEMIRNNIISEICKRLNIPSVSENKQAVINYIDEELEERTKLDKKTEKEILSRLSNRGELPTDLYTVKMDKNNIVKVFSDAYKENENLIMETVKKPDMAYNFGVDYCTSLFTKYYKDKYDYNNFFILVVGIREGLVFRVSQVWWLYNDILKGNSFADAFELLKYFVEKFGIEVDFQGETSKFFIDVIAKTEREFQVKVKEGKLKKSKKGEAGFVTCHFLGQTPDNKNNLSIFFAIDIEKYKEYLTRHLRKTQIKN